MEKKDESKERFQNKTAAPGCQHALFIKLLLRHTHTVSLSLSCRMHPYSTVTPKHHATKGERWPPPPAKFSPNSPVSRIRWRAAGRWPCCFRRLTFPSDAHRCSHSAHPSTSVTGEVRQVPPAAPRDKYRLDWRGPPTSRRPYPLDTMLRVREHALQARVVCRDWWGDKYKEI